MDNTKPFLGPLKELFQSRKFLLALIFIILAVAVRVIPVSTDTANILTNLLLVGLGAPFLHLSVVDILAAWKTGQPTDLVSAVQEVVADVIKEFLPLLTSTQTTTVSNDSGDTATVTTTPVATANPVVEPVAQDPTPVVQSDTSTLDGDKLADASDYTQAVALQPVSVNLTDEAIAKVAAALAATKG